MDDLLFDQAHKILSMRRAKAQAENDSRIREINEKIPEIRQINEALFKTGKELISIIAKADGKDVSAQVEQIKQNNLGAQQVAKDILVTYGYPSDYLDMHYTCPKCGDTGYIRTNFCDCMNILFAKLATEQLNEKTQLTLSSFDTFSLKYYEGDDYFDMERMLNYTKAYAADFTPASESICMYGNTGLGKTHISLAIASIVLQKGYSVIYDSAMNILRDIEKEHFSRERSSEMLDLITGTDLLILDDLGTEFESKFYNAAVYNVINARLTKQKPTIISTNMDMNAISKRYGGKVASRIATMYKLFEFKGNDVRYQIKLSKT